MTTDTEVGGRKKIPVYSRQCHILAKWRGMLVGLLEDAMAMLDIVRRVEGMIDSHDHHQSP